jgi:hypothetical protein
MIIPYIIPSKDRIPTTKYRGSCCHLSFFLNEFRLLIVNHCKSLLARVSTLNISYNLIFSMTKKICKVLAIMAALAVGAIGISTMAAPIAEAGMQLN